MAEQKLSQYVVEAAAKLGGNAQRISEFVAEVAHTGGVGPSVSQRLSQYITEVGTLHEGGSLKVSQYVCEVAYKVTYPNVPLTKYEPRILIDIYLDSGVQHYSTEDKYVRDI